MAYRRVHRIALGGTSVATGPPEPGRAQPPIYPLEVGAHGAWLEVRATSADGSCGVHGYPCQHPGVDVAGAAGTPVVAPESGQIVLVGDGNSPPFVGYGPWFVVILGQGGQYHLLAHLEPMAASMGPMGATVTAGDQVGVTSSANHTHWEVRDQMVPPSGETNFDNNTDPLAWLSRAAIGVGTVMVVVGAVLFLVLLRRRS